MIKLQCQILEKSLALAYNTTKFIQTEKENISWHSQRNNQVLARLACVAAILLRS